MYNFLKNDKHHERDEAFDILKGAITHAIIHFQVQHLPRATSPIDRRKIIIILPPLSYQISFVPVELIY